MTTQQPHDTLRSGVFTVPRWLALGLAPLVWLVAIPIGHGIVPWLISLLGSRHGWLHGRPAFWNLFGLVPVAAGAAVLIWLMVFGFAQADRLPERVELNWRPKLLLTKGPYAFTRHPMYVAELALWLGWAMLYGSASVLISFLILCLVVNAITSREERTLEANFGGEFREYKARVPKWLPIRK